MVAKKESKPKTSKKKIKKEVITKENVKKKNSKEEEISETEEINTCPVCKSESIYLAAGLVIGILIMFAYTQINTNTGTNINGNFINTGGDYVSLQEAEAIVLEVVSMDPNLETLNVTPSIVNSSEENGIYSVNVKLAGGQGDMIFNSFLTKDGKILFPSKGINIEEYKKLINEQPAPTLDDEIPIDTGNENIVAGNFIETQDAVCMEDEKPIVYFFGSENCGYCKWEKPVIEAVAAEFKDYISFHNYMGDFGEDRAIFSKYSTGGVPTMVLGCKYYRVGAGSDAGEELEKENLRTLLCNFTQNQPEEICSAL